MLQVTSDLNVRIYFDKF